MISLWTLRLAVLIGCAAPLLMVARLFQMKEWRWDRLQEHLRREGWGVSLLGRARMLYGIITILSIMLGVIHVPLWLGVAALWSLVAILSGHQRPPVWTKKALLLTGTALTLTAIAILWTDDALVVLPLFCLLQPFTLGLAWLLWKPLDVTLKRRLLATATVYRAAMPQETTVIGVVGSVGKTTTKELLACVLQDLSPAVTPEHVNTELGVAAWLLTQTAATTPLLIVEMGAYRVGEIATLCRMTRPTIAVVTALGSDHLALFGSEEAIVDANAEILTALPGTGHAFFLAENATSAGLATRAPCPVTLAGTKDAQNLHETDRGLTWEQGGTRFTVALHGLHNAGNAMLAISVARHLGIADERIRSLLASYRSSAHTFHLRQDRGITVLDDTYNVSPLSFRAALTWAAARPERPRVLLTSGLLETGDAEERFLTELGTLARTSVERVIFTNPSGRAAFERAFGQPIELLTARTAAVPDDALLLCVGRMSPHVIHRLLPS